MENSTGTFHRDCVLKSFCECRRHYSSWGVSRESQSSPLRFFVESNATNHQEVSSFFSDENPKNPSLVDFERATWSLESCHLTTPPPWPIYFIIIICIIYSCPKCSIRKIGHPQPNHLIVSNRFWRTFSEDKMFLLLIGKTVRGGVHYMTQQ